MRKCTKCNIEKLPDCFRKAKGYKYGLFSVCKECEANGLREWRSKNKDKVKAQQFRSRKIRKENGWIAEREWRNRNPYKPKGRYLRTPEQKKIEDHEAKKQWKKNNPSRVRAHLSLRRARIRGAYIKEVIDPKIVYDRDNGICRICETAITEKYELDHVIPISKGGEHSYSNIQLAHPTCNRRKNNKIEFTMITDK